MDSESSQGLQSEDGNFQKAKAGEQREQSAHPPPRPKSAAAPRRHQTLNRTTTRVGARLFVLCICLDFEQAKASVKSIGPTSKSLKDFK